MQKYIIFIYSLAICFLWGCQDDTWMEGRTDREQNGEVPVEFIMELPQNGLLTRAEGGELVEVGEKTEFEEGDIIQIVGNFYSGMEDTEKDVTLVSSVCCYLTYAPGSDGGPGKWVNNTERPLYWPFESEWATFSAFYYPQYNGLIEPGASTEAVLLEALEINTDPLRAESIEKIEYGQAVKLEFQHACTRLILTDVEEVLNGSYDKLWLTVADDDSKKTNAFKLHVKEETLQTATGGEGKVTENENKELAFELEWVAETVPGQSTTSIGGKKYKITTQEGTGEEKKAFVFFLSPGDYSDVSLTRRLGRSLLSWKGINELNNLQTGKSYTLSLKDMSGNIIIDENDDWWREEEEDYVNAKDFKLQDFLDALAAGTAYSFDKNGKKVQVLEEDGNSVYLLKGVDFNDERDFTPVDLNSGITFDGNGYFFKNVKRNIFKATNGKIQNLGIKDSRLEQVQLEENANVGLLAREIKGEIAELRLENVGIEISSIASSSDNIFSVGVLGGQTKADISGIEIEGLEVVVNETQIEKGTLYLGGLVGQLGDGKKIDGVSISGAERITITNKLTAQTGNIYTGGLAGTSAGNILNSNIRADVDASQANGGVVYTGGLVGQMRGSQAGEEHIQVRNSMNEGSVKGGTCHRDQDEDESRGHSSTGGLVGYALSKSDIQGCVVSGETISATIGGKDLMVYYSVGGIVGTVMPAKSEDKDNYPVVKSNQVYVGVDSNLAPEERFCMVGWLAGIAPDNIDEEMSNTVSVQTSFKKIGLVSNDQNPDDTDAPGTE